MEKYERNHDQLILDILDYIFLKICGIFNYFEKKIEKKPILLKDIVIRY